MAEEQKQPNTENDAQETANEQKSDQREVDDRRTGLERRKSGLDVRVFANNHYIFREHEAGDFAFVVQSGTVEIVKMAGDQEIVIGTINVGGMFGEMALLDDKLRMASARAFGRVEVLVITREMMAKKLAKIDPFAKALISVLSDHVRVLAKNMDHDVT